MYNMSFTEGGSIVGMFVGVNQESGGLMGGILLLTIFIIVLISTKTDDIKTKMTVSSFITTLMAGVMLGMGWIPQLYFIISAFALFISAFILIWSKE